MSSHKSASKTRLKDGCVALNAAILTHGWDNIEKKVLVYCMKDRLDIAEEKMINVFNSLEPNGYNLLSGGNSNKKQHNTMKNKASLAHIRNSRKKNPHKVRYGCIFPHRTQMDGTDGKRGRDLRKFAIMDHPLCEFKSFDNRELALIELSKLNKQATKQGIDVSEYILDEKNRLSSTNSYADVKDLMIDMVHTIEKNHYKSDRYKRINNANKLKQNECRPETISEVGVE